MVKWRELELLVAADRWCLCMRNADRRFYFIREKTFFAVTSAECQRWKWEIAENAQSDN